MKKLIVVILLLIPITALAWTDNSGKRPYKDYWGNNYKHYDNLWKDSDRDGVPNYYDYNDKNPRIQNPYQYDYQRDYQRDKNNRYRYRW